MKVEKRGRKPLLTAEQKEEIKRLDADGMTYREIGLKFGISHVTVGKAVNGK